MSGPRSPFLSPRATAALGGCLLCVLVAIHLFIWSPWHRHDPFSGAVCSFSQFEHGSMLAPGGHIQLEPPGLAPGQAAEPAAPSTVFLASRHSSGRAPPASSRSII